MSIYRESWYKETVRAIKVDLGLVKRIVNNLLFQLRDIAKSYPDDYSFEPVVSTGGVVESLSDKAREFPVETVDGKQTTVVALWQQRLFNLPWVFYMEASFSSAVYPGDPNVILAHFNSSYTPAKIREFLDKPGRVSTLLEELESNILHELTHARDVIRLQDRRNYREDPEGYYNSPHEVRAYMRQIVSEVVKEVGSWSNDLIAIWFGSAQDMFAEALNRSDNWRTRKKHFNAQSRKKILQAVWQALEDKGEFERYHNAVKQIREELRRDTEEQ